MRKKKESCVYETHVRIGDKKWQWCSFFKAWTKDIDCKNCDLRTWKKREKALHPKTELLLA